MLFLSPEAEYAHLCFNCWKASLHVSNTCGLRKVQGAQCLPTVLTWIVWEYFFLGPVASRKRVVSCTLQRCWYGWQMQPFSKCTHLQPLQGPPRGAMTVVSVQMQRPRKEAC